MNPSTQPLIGLAAAWALYFVVHSALASLAVKEWVARHWPGAMPYYRLAFNTLAVLLLIPPALLTLLAPGPWLWRWSGAARWAADALMLLAAAGFLWTTRYYAMDEFLGLLQWRRREHSACDTEGFHLSPLHRYVRHPWYFLGLVILWSRDMNPAYLMSAAIITAYLVIGSHLEERKLIAFHGEPYRRYMAKVPGLFPLPWRHLSRAEAQALEAEAK